MAVGFNMDTALSGLSASQRALEVTGHNVSNLGTAGYSRQSVQLATAATRSYGNWKVEMGVNIQEIKQIRSTFTDNIYRSEANSLGYWTARSNAVKDVESILGEPMTDGLQVSLNNFWDSWQELSKAPESLTARALVKQRSESLVEGVNHIGAQLSKLQSDLNDEIKTRIDEVNDITGQLAQLNIKIMSSQAASNSPNDYLDQRNALTDKLSNLINAQTWEGQDGSLDILVGGYFLVSKGVQTKLVAAPNQDLSHFYTPKVEGINMPIDLGQGEIKGLIEARGAVDGSKGSFDNGTPNTTADVTIAVDLANTSTADLTKIQANIKEMADDMSKRGLNYNLKLVTFGDGTITQSDYGKNAVGLSAYLASHIPAIPPGGNYDFGAVVNAVTTSTPFTNDANKYLMVFTNESINGNGGTAATDANIDSYVKALNTNGITVSVITDPSDPGDAGEKGWNAITDQTGGKTYDLESSNYTGLMDSLSKGVNDDVNMKISTIPDGLNIISSVRKQLNAVINIMARQVNYIHQSGKTLIGAGGTTFFDAVNPNIPIEMGNFQVNSLLKDPNKIAASTMDANGDNTISLEIANLRNANVMTGNKKILSLDTYYQNVILDIGNKGYEAENMVTSQTNLVNQCDSIRQTTMGVSLDEEMANMMKYRYSYNASSKLIDAVNTMLDTVINRTGIAGR